MLQYQTQIERWSYIEISINGENKGNPFVDHTVKGTFTCTHETKTVEGFYDGNGIYKVRFMPSFLEEYSFEISGSFSDQKYHGAFSVNPAKHKNHGPVRVANTFHFAYEDGTPYYPVGTTCYVWELQNDDTQKKTIELLKDGAFNKLRFCIFPKHYDYNLNEPNAYPYIGAPCDSSFLNSENFNEFTGKVEGNEWNYTYFNVNYFQHLDSVILKLQEIGVEADLIIMHPYDRWGFSMMTKDQDDLYVKYIVSRYSAFRNVWWSLANEYDLMFTKTLEDWERIATLICKYDSYHHLRSIHNCKAFYDYTRPWITHCSIQRQDIYKAAEYVDEWRIRFQKPIVIDEIGYEGNIQHGWGNLSGKELVRRFWEATCRGGYCGHGETYLADDNILWWSHGGILKGESHKRIKFLRKILEAIPSVGLKPIQMKWDEVCAIPDTMETLNLSVQNFYLFYYGFNRPSFREYYFDDETRLQVDVIDTWEMTIKRQGIFNGKFKIQLPGKEYMAVRITKAK